MYYFYCACLIYTFVYMKDNTRERGRRDFSLVIYCPDTHSSRVWESQILWTWNYTSLFRGGQEPETCTITCRLLRSAGLLKLKLEAEWDSNLCRLVWNACPPAVPSVRPVLQILNLTCSNGVWLKVTVVCIEATILKFCFLTFISIKSSKWIIRDESWDIWNADLEPGQQLNASYCTKRTMKRSHHSFEIM